MHVKYTIIAYWLYIVCRVDFFRVVLTRLFLERLSVVRPHERGHRVALHLAPDEEVGVLVCGLFGGRFEFQYFCIDKRAQ